MPEAYQTKYDREHGVGSLVETLGGPDVTQVFVHDATSVTNWEEVAAITPGMHRYDERALVFARAHDLVCISGKVDDQYLEYLSNLAIGPSRGNVIVSPEGMKSRPGAGLLELLTNNREVLSGIRELVNPVNRIVLNPFVGSREYFKLASILQTATGRKVHVLGGDPGVVDFADGKHNVRKKAMQLGVPVSEGGVVEIELREDGRPADLTPVRAAIDRHIHRTGKVIVKGAYGAGGSSTVIVDNNPESLRKALSIIGGKRDNRIYLVEVMLDVIASTNILLHVEPDDGLVQCVSVTDQLLTKELMHEGNLCPSRAKTLKKMVGAAQQMSNWLQAQGYRGLLGFDFGEYLNSETGEPQHFLAEINPRINAAVYPKALMEHLNKKQGKQGRPYIEACLSANIHTGVSSFAELNKSYGHLFFRPETGTGFFPYNIGCLEYGKFTLAVFGKSRNEVLQRYDEVMRLGH